MWKLTIMVSSTRKIDVYSVLSWVRMCSPGVPVYGVRSSTEVRQRAMTASPMPSSAPRMVMAALSGSPVKTDLHAALGGVEQDIEESVERVEQERSRNHQNVDAGARMSEMLLPCGDR